MIKNAQLTLSVQLPDDETFNSYQSQINQAVCNLLKDFIRPVTETDDKKAPISGFYLFGIQGVGKSHLLHACCAQAQEDNQTSVCLSFSELRNLSVEVLDGLENIDLICLDDIQNIAGETDWQQAVFDLYNRVAEQNKKLIITGDKSIHDLALTLPDLRSRLSWGFVEQVKPLSDDEKLLAIQYRAQQRGLMLTHDVAKFLLTRLSRDMKDLTTALNKLDNASIREQRKITIPFIKDVLLS
ncbi:DnaA regulatory inactivator Hda [Colwelliaceae bacterium 6441]